MSLFVLFIEVSDCNSVDVDKIQFFLELLGSVQYRHFLGLIIRYF